MRGTVRTDALEYFAQSDKSPDWVKMRQLEANCAIARKWLFERTNTLDFRFLSSCQREFLRSYDFNLANAWPPELK